MRQGRCIILHVDISRFIDIKVESNVVCKTQGPGGNNGARLRERLAKEGKKLEILGDDDKTANFNYIKEFILEQDRINGEKYGLAWAEDGTRTMTSRSRTSFAACASGPVTEKK